jgi:hypothetical protein
MHEIMPVDPFDVYRLTTITAKVSGNGGVASSAVHGITKYS